jgi:hypothetical protein
MNKKTIVIILFAFMVQNLTSQERCVDVAYEFSLGKYNILVSSVNIYSQPYLTSSVIGGLDLHSEIEIIETVENSQTTMEGATHYWYKIRFNNDTGYVWGGYIAKETSVFDFDDTKVYCYYRVSSIVKYGNNRFVPSVMPNDIFVYFNDRRINNNVIEEGYKEFGKNYRGEQIRDKCYFVILERENFILKKFILFGHSGDGYIDQYYIKENGEIVYGGHMWACD